MKRGEIIKDFRDQEWKFVQISRTPGNGKDGKVVVADEFGREREFYWSVFDSYDFMEVVMNDEGS